jgi:hypothetical protein
MLKITDLIVNYGVGLLTVVMLLIYSMPYFHVHHDGSPADLFTIVGRQ